MGIRAAAEVCETKQERKGKKHQNQEGGEVLLQSSGGAAGSHDAQRPQNSQGVQGCHPNIVMPIEALATGQGEVMCPGVMPFSTRNRNLVNSKMFL